MRITPSDIKNAITNPAYRISSKPRGGPSTDSTVRKAIRQYHEYGVEAASASLESGLSNEYWHGKLGLTKAKIARELVDTYIDMASRDNRPGTPATRHTVHWRGHEIAANVDVLVMDPRGHVGRVCFTAALGRQLTIAEQALIAAAPLRGLQIEFENMLFDNVIAEIEIWELRIGTTSRVEREAAERAWPELTAHVIRALG